MTLQMSNIVVRNPTFPGLMPDTEILALAMSFFKKIANEGNNVFSLPRLPTVDERATLQNRLRNLNVTFRPIRESTADQGRAAAAFVRMFHGYSSLQNQDLAEKGGVYAMFVLELPLFAIEAACEDVMHSKVPDLDPDWPPTAPRVYAIAEQHRSKAYMREVHPIERVLAVKKISTPPRHPTLEEEARMAELLHGLANKIKVDDDTRLCEIRTKVHKDRHEWERQRQEQEWTMAGREPPKTFISVALAKSLGGFDKTKKLPQRKNR